MNKMRWRNFFNNLVGVIFTSKEKRSKRQKMDNRQPFVLYSIIFYFNPRATSYLFDHYLDTLYHSICEDNRPDFSFLSEIFSDVVLAFFPDEKKKKNLIKKSFLLEQEKKKFI